jgi:uncharacterized membrane protein YbhN (UPF0104 family)
VAFAVLVYLGALLWIEGGELVAAWRTFTPAWLAAALALSTVNYLLRFAKWELCLGWLDVRATAPRLTLGRSLTIYISGLSMSVTPGKLGEVLRSALLRASDGVPFARTAPVVVADRLTDLLALVILAAAGLADSPRLWPFVATTLVLVVAAVVVLGTPALARGTLGLAARLPGLGGLGARMELLVTSSHAVLRPGRLALLTALSVGGWWLECLGYWCILQGFPGVTASLADCTFLWSVCTLVGALSFLPGGLGATEGSISVLMLRLTSGATSAIAVASTLLIRGATLWWGELLGSLGLLVFLRDPAVSARRDQLEL